MTFSLPQGRRWVSLVGCLAIGWAASGLGSGGLEQGASMLSATVVNAAEPIVRVLPPVGIEIPDDVRAKLTATLSDLRKRLDALSTNPNRADVEVYLKAVDYALRHREFYVAKDFDKALTALARAADRLTELEANRASWKQDRGLVVRGYRSELDDSAQPYGLVIPATLDLSRPAPLYVWLHGRGDKQTDLHFIHERERSVGQIAPPDAIVVHPFGRHCLGFKSAGEIDVLETVDHVCREYPIDKSRIVLIGFSMGGAGAWHLGAHYADRWCAVSPGAGFAETAQYNKLAPAQFPPHYEQRLWGCYDVPDYVRNLFNVPVIAYSGENDKQIQAARVMEQAFEREGKKLHHLIGPGVEHKYEPKTLNQLLELLQAEVQKGRADAPRKLSLQTRTLRYAKQFWVEARGLGQHWEDARIDADWAPSGALTVTTKNITAVRLTPPGMVTSLQMDGQSITLTETSDQRPEFQLERAGGKWSRLEVPMVRRPEGLMLRKAPGIQGPIDDAFLEPFLVVEPTGNSPFAQAAEWAKAEREHFSERWRAVCRGELRYKNDVDVTRDDMQRYHLILWGDAHSNRLIGQMHGRLPLRWVEKELVVGKQRYSAESHVPAMVYPNPLHPDRYVVLNSGLTFREAHDRTNSLQNPKLPDWAVIDVTQPATAERPGAVAAADFFDEQWQLRPTKRQ